MKVEGGRVVKVVKVEWGRQELTGTIPAELCELDGLKGLELSCNEIGGLLPSAIGKLTALKWLQLYDNGLEGSIPLWETKETAEAYLATLKATSPN